MRVWRRNLGRLGRDFRPLAAAFALMFAASFLPPDASRMEVDEVGLLRVCLPNESPPWTATDQNRPGFDVEVLQAVTDRLGWRLEQVPVAAMDAGVNPRGWGIRRSRCRMIAGGLALTPLTRGMLDAGPAWATSGWQLISRDGRNLRDVEGDVAALLDGPGQDRLAVGALLRAEGIPAHPVASFAELEMALEAGHFEAAIAGPAVAAALEKEAWVAADLPPPLDAHDRGPGFWKGDATLAAAIRKVLRQLEAEGTLAALRARYGLASPENE